MYKHKKEHKNYKSSKPHHKYQESETSIGSSVWEYAGEPNASKHVKFDSNYGYSSHNEFHDGQTKNLYSYPYYYNNSSNNMYGSGNEIQNYYDSEDSQYTYYQRHPQQIMYTETDSAFTMADSDYSAYNYHKKNSQNYQQRDREKNKFSRNTRNAFGENVGVYFVQEPSSHHTFQLKKSPRQDSSSPSEPETHKGFITETDEETDYTTDDKVNHTIKNIRKKPVQQVYRTYLGENKGAFKNEVTTTTDDREMLISVTDYDNVPLLAFETTNTSVEIKNSLSRVVYLPVLVSGTKNNDTVLTSGNIKNQSIYNKHFEIAEKPIENIKVYAALNTGQKSIFEQSNDNKHQKLLELKSEKLGATTNRSSKSKNRNSDLVSGPKVSKKSYTNLTSILKVPIRKRSESGKSERSESNESQVGKHDPSKIRNITSDTSVASGISVLGVGNKKKTSNKKRTDKNKKSVAKTKSNISNKSQSSSKWSTINFQASRRSKRKSGARDSEIKLPIGQTPQGNIEGSSYYADSHELELERRNELKKIYGEVQDPTGKELEKQEQSKLNIFKKTKSNDEETKFKGKIKNIQSEIKINESKVELPLENKQSKEVNKKISSLTLPETKGKNVSNVRSNTMNQQHSSMIGRNQISNKSVLPTDLRLEQNNKTAAEINFPRQQSVVQTQESKKFDLGNIEGNKNESQSSKQNGAMQGGRKSLVKKSTTLRGNGTLQNKSGAQSQDGDKEIEQNKGDKNLKTQLSVQNDTVQGGRLSIIQESMIEFNNIDRQNQSLQASKNDLAKGSRIEGENSIAQNQVTTGNRISIAKGSSIEGKTTLVQNQATPGSRISTAKGSRIEGETTLVQNQVTLGSRIRTAKGGSSIEGETTKVQNQVTPGSRIRTAKGGSSIEGETTKVQNQVTPGSRISRAKGSRIEGETTLVQNQATQGSRISTAKGSRIEGKTTPDQDKALQDSKKNTEQATLSGDTKHQLEENKKNPSLEDKEVKSIYQRKSQINENRSLELNIDVTKKVLKDNENASDSVKSTVRRKSQIFQPQSQQKANEDIKTSFVKKETPILTDKDVMTQRDSMPPEDELKSEINSILNNNQEQQTRSVSKTIKGSVAGFGNIFGTDREQKGGSTEGGVKNEIDEKNHKSLIASSKQKSRVEGGKISQVRRNTNQKNLTKGLYEVKISRIPVSDDLSDPRTGQESSINQNDRSIKMEKGFQKEVSESKFIGNDKKKSKQTPFEKDTIKISSEQLIIDKNENLYQYLMKLKNYKVSSLVTYCFRISQFILGVSTYDKFIEVLGNFN